MLEPAGDGPGARRSLMTERVVGSDDGGATSGLMTIIQRMFGLADARLARSAAAILIPTLFVVAGCVALAMSTSDAKTARILDNVHWTVSYSAAAALAWLGARFAPAPDMRAKRWFAWALTGYAVGQVLWDAQVVTGWNPFPGPSDAFYILLGPATGVGCMLLLLRSKGRTEHRTALLDSGGLSIAVLALTLAMYLPKRGQTEWWPMAFLVAYPVVLCWAASTGLILVLAHRLQSRRGLLLFFCDREVNPRGAEMLGMQRDEVIGMHIGDVVVPEEVERVAPAVDRLRRGETMEGTWTFRRKDGSTFQGEVTGKQLADGRLQGFVRDVSHPSSTKFS